MPTAAAIPDTLRIEQPAAPSLVVRTPTDPQRPVMAGGASWLYGAWSASLRTLPPAIDDITADFGRDIYRRMGWDPAVQSATRLLRTLATGAELAIGPAADGEAVTKARPEFQTADRVATFCTRNLQRVDLRRALWDLSAAITEGHTLLENVWTTATLDAATGPQLVLDTLAPKPPESYALAVDPYGGQPGLVYAPPGMPLVQQTYLAPGPDGTIPHFLPRWRYTLYSFDPAFGDPRGRSIARSSYHAWLVKQQSWTEYIKYLATLASALLIAKTAPLAQPIGDVTPEADMLAALQTLRNGGVAVLPAGSELQAIQVQGEGRAFTSAIDLCNKEITLSILMSARATMEAEHGSKADTGTAQDVLEAGVARLRADLADVIRRDVLTPLIRANYGDAALRFLPIVNLTGVERHDRAAEWTALAVLDKKGHAIHDSMWADLRRSVDLPAADEEAEAADYATAQAAAERLAAQPPPVAPGPEGAPPPNGPQRPAPAPPGAPAPQEKPA